jgi:hypothetical protein
MSVPALALSDPALVPRDERWLREEVDDVWARYFPDTPRVNSVDVAWQRPWKRRLGVISLSHDERTTRIGLNCLLARPEVPYCVALITIAHELVHYAHGFGSPLPRKYPHPHRGNVVVRELKARGLAHVHDEYLEWIDQHWWSFYARHGQRRRR